MKTTRIVIGGGGFAGLYAAIHFDKRLARRADVEVTLISRENFILFTPMLHEVAAGDLYPGDIVNPLRRILHHVPRLARQRGSGFFLQTLGRLASIGHHTGVAMVFGIKFSGFVAWCFCEPSTRAKRKT